MTGRPFALDPEKEGLVEEARRLASRELAPIAAAGMPGRVNRPLIRALAETGLLPRLFPRRAGGSSDGEVSSVELCLLREGLAMGSTEAETALALQGLGSYPILQSGSESLLERYVAPVARGQAVAAFALSEPEHGSDAGALELRADREGDGYRLTGTKAWISNAPDADVYTVFARTTEGAGPRGVTAFAVPGDAAGLSGEPTELLAPHAIGRLTFDGVAAPADHVLGEVDRGFVVGMRTLDLFRPSVGAYAVGMARAALAASLEHAAERRTFGKALREHQTVAHLLADMATRTQAARLMVYEAAFAHDAGSSDITLRSAMAKLFATETAQRVVDAAVQIHGAAALQRGHLLEHLYRDVRAPRIYEGASEIQRQVIARELFRQG